MENWKRVSGVLCDRIMNVNIKGKVYRILVRPALVYEGRDMGIEEGTGKYWRSQKCECYDGCAELRWLEE